MIKFLHIPKTAGTSILNAMNATSEGHKMICDVEGCSFFSCVRNPYDRACSIYWFMLGKWLKMRKMHPFDMSAEPASLLFFWQTIDKRQHPTAKWLYSPQMDFLRDEKGKGGISARIKTLLRFETLNDDWSAFASAHSYKDLPHVNKSERPELWRDEMTPELVAIINERFADDFEHLNYERID